MAGTTSMAGMATTRDQALAVADWRRRVHDLYAAVRASPSPADAHAAWVSGREALFDTHPASPRREGQSLRHAAYDPAYRFEVPIAAAPAEAWTYSTGSDGDAPFTRVGAFELPGLGTLDVWWLESYGGGLFVPVKDRTNGDLTYGAGRYLLDTVKGADLGRSGDTWVVDLNFAYHPSCVHDPAWACPLAPAGNALAAAAPVGELLPAG